MQKASSSSSSLGTSVSICPHLSVLSCQAKTPAGQHIAYSINEPEQIQLCCLLFTGKVCCQCKCGTVTLWHTHLQSACQGRVCHYNTFKSLSVLYIHPDFIFCSYIQKVCSISYKMFLQNKLFNFSPFSILHKYQLHF